jgi:radical SAM protein with 4Fe4S-binding SPASM domain
MVHKTMTVAQVREVIKRLAAAGVFDITFTGGEPLMAFKALVAGIEAARSYGMSVSINSNLIPLTAKRAKILYDLGIRGILTSFMGPDAETYDAIAQQPGAFRHAVRGITIARTAGINVTTNMVVSKANLHKIMATAQFVQSLGVTRFAATKVCHPAHSQEFSVHTLSPDEFQEYLRIMAKIRNDLGMEVTPLVSYPLCGVGDLSCFDFTLGRRCSAGISTIQIGTDGMVRPCAHSDERYGNVFTEEITEIWIRMRAYRSGEYLPETCKACSIFARCGGGCRVEAKMCHGDISAPDPYWQPGNTDVARQSMKKSGSPLGENDLLHKDGTSQRFMILSCRARVESFGLAIAVGRSRVHLTHKAAAIFQQMESDVPYDIASMALQWNGVDPVMCINEFIRRGLAKKL